METCQHEGCIEQAAEYELYDWKTDKTNKFLFCGEHASKFGFCCLCGHFTAGADDRWLYSHGVCEDCFDEIRQENGEYDDYEEYDLY